MSWWENGPRLPSRPTVGYCWFFPQAPEGASMIWPTIGCSALMLEFLAAEPEKAIDKSSPNHFLPMHNQQGVADVESL